MGIFKKEMASKGVAVFSNGVRSNIFLILILILGITEDSSEWSWYNYRKKIL